MSTPPGSTRRLFWAVLPPAGIVDELAGQVGDSGLPTRWTPPAQWHVTLLFTPHAEAGDVQPFVDGVTRRLAEVEPFQLAVRGGGAFPDVTAARHLVALLDDPSASLPVLHRACDEVATHLGIGHEDRPYQPHLTLARVSPAADRSADARWLDRIATHCWTVDEVALVESVLGGPGDGARHTVVERVPLAG